MYNPQNTEIMSQDDISFHLPKNKSNVIKVIGVGGGGSNAVNYMYNQGFNDVDFVICNTDAQALENSPVPNKIQLGVSLTEGLGAGANPEVGGKSAEESLGELEEMLSSKTKMIFLTAGMGGGTGTGAAPVIAKLASKLGILTVGIVTVPFQFEGKRRIEQAQLGIEELRKHVDSLIVINNSKLREVYGNMGYKVGFAKADEVLATAARGISQVITNHYGMNIDLHDAKTVLSKSGTAIMGSAEASGDNRAIEAITKALDSPLLNDNKITGAKAVLLLIVSGEKEITFDEMGEINDYIHNESGGTANVILGLGDDPSLGENVSITIIATGFSSEQQDKQVEKEPSRKVHILTDKAPKTVKVVDKVVSVVEKESEIVNKQEPKKVVHILKEDIVEEREFVAPIQQKDSKPKEDVVFIEKVEKEEVIKIKEVEEEIIIKNVSPETEMDTTEQQITIEFDFEDIVNSTYIKDTCSNDIEEPDSRVEKRIVHELKDFEKDIISDLPYVQQEESSPVSEVQKVVSQDKFGDDSVRYNLDDYTRLEEEINNSKPKEKKPNQTKVSNEEPELKIELKKNTDSKGVTKKTLPNPNLRLDDIVKSPVVEEEYVDPTDVPLSKIERIGIDRRNRLKKFNHKFKTTNPTTIDEIEKQPAYKRAGIDVTSTSAKSNNSRYSLGNEDDDFVIRSNNSFLHDNVD